MSRTVILSPINSYLWPIPLPKPCPRGLPHILFPILGIVKGHLYQRGIEYCWLDILCLRQQGGIEEEQRPREWEIDVPTIGNIFRNAIIVVRYLNGLGKNVNNEVVAWKESQHWTNRAWTLQETKPDDQMSTPDGRGELNLMQVVDGTNPPQTVRQLLHPISRIAGTAHSPRGCGIIALVREIIRRCASNPLDQVAGISYLMWPAGSRFDLPIYNMDMNVEASWLKCADSMRLELKLELLFLYPNPRADTFLMTGVDTVLDFISKLGGQRTPFQILNPQTMARDLWQDVLRDSSPQWLPTWEQLNNFTMDSFWDELRLPSLSKLRLSYTGHPLLVPTYMSNLNTPFGTFVMENCALRPPIDSNPPGRTSKQQRWDIWTTKPEGSSPDDPILHFTGYAPIDTVLRPSVNNGYIHDWEGRWTKQETFWYYPFHAPQPPGHDARPLEFLDLRNVDFLGSYILLGLSLDIQAPWLVCLEYMDAMYLRTGDDSFKGVSSIAAGITAYPRTLVLQKVAVVWTDERSLLARTFPQTIPWPKREYDAIYIV